MRGGCKKGRFETSYGCTSEAPLAAHVAQNEVSVSYFCAVIDREFRHNIDKVAVNPQTILSMI